MNFILSKLHLKGTARKRKMDGRKVPREETQFGSTKNAGGHMNLLMDHNQETNYSSQVFDKSKRKIKSVNLLEEIKTVMNNHEIKKEDDGDKITQTSRCIDFVNEEWKQYNLDDIESIKARSSVSGFQDKVEGKNNTENIKLTNTNYIKKESEVDISKEKEGRIAISPNFKFTYKKNDINESPDIKEDKSNQDLKRGAPKENISQKITSPRAFLMIGFLSLQKFYISLLTSMYGIISSYLTILNIIGNGLICIVGDIFKGIKLFFTGKNNRDEKMMTSRDYYMGKIRQITIFILVIDWVIYFLTSVTDIDIISKVFIMRKEGFSPIFLDVMEWLGNEVCKIVGEVIMFLCTSRKNMTGLETTNSSQIHLKTKDQSSSNRVYRKKEKDENTIKDNNGSNEKDNCDEEKASVQEENKSISLDEVESLDYSKILRLSVLSGIETGFYKNHIFNTIMRLTDSKEKNKDPFGLDKSYKKDRVEKSVLGVLGLVSSPNFKLLGLVNRILSFYDGKTFEALAKSNVAAKLFSPKKMYSALNPMAKSETKDKKDDDKQKKGKNKDLDELKDSVLKSRRNELYIVTTYLYKVIVEYAARIILGKQNKDVKIEEDNAFDNVSDESYLNGENTPVKHVHKSGKSHHRENDETKSKKHHHRAHDVGERIDKSMTGDVPPCDDEQSDIFGSRGGLSLKKGFFQVIFTYLSFQISAGLLDCLVLYVNVLSKGEISEDNLREYKQTYYMALEQLTSISAKKKSGISEEDIDDLDEDSVKFDTKHFANIPSFVVFIHLIMVLIPGNIWMKVSVLPLLYILIACLHVVLDKIILMNNAKFNRVLHETKSEELK